LSSETLWYGFADESGDTLPFSKAPLILAAVVTPRPRPLEVLVRRALKKWGTSLRTGELKAAYSNERLLIKLLRDVAKADVAIVTVAFDKTSIVRPPGRPEALYYATAGRLLRLCVERWPHIEFVFDKRYTTKRQEREFERALRNGIADLPNTVVAIYQQDSTVQKELQVADYVVWAAGRRFEGEESYWGLVAGKVVAEEIIRREKW